MFTNDTPTNPGGGVTAFPNEGTYFYNGVVDDYNTLTSTYNQTMPINAGTSAWAMQDDWLSQPGDTNWDYEVMIQEDFSNNGACSSSGLWAVVATDVMFDGVAWHLCDGQGAHNANGTCPSSGCGSMVWKLGATEADRPSTPTTSGTLDLKAMFQWLENNDVPGESYPYITPGSSVEALSQGWEIASTGGVPEQFGGNGFTVAAS